MSWTIRAFTEDDLDDAVAAATREGWTPSRTWFAAVLADGPDLCFVAEAAGRPVGMVTAAGFAESGWVGNLIVDPSQRRRGLGEALMCRAIAALEARGIGTLRLDADPPGINIYRRLGFVEEQLSRRFLLDAAPAAVGTPGLPRLESVSAIAARDRVAFGDDRSRLLSLVLPHAVTSAVLEGPDGPSGYALAIPAAAGVKLGPCVADDSGGAAALLASCLAACAGSRIVAGCLEGNAQAAAVYAELGFRETAPSVRMVRGPLAAAGNSRENYAIANGAVG